MTRLFNLLKGLWLSLIGKAEQKMPRALLQTEISDFNKAMQSYNVNLAKQATVIQTLTMKIKYLEKEVEVLFPKMSVARDSREFDRAGSFALRIKEARQEIIENEDYLVQSKKTYADLLEQRTVYEKQFRTRVTQLKNKISKTEMLEAQSALSNAINSLSAKFSGTGLTFENIDTGLNDRLASAQGKLYVNDSTLQLSEWKVTKNEQKVLEMQALAELSEEFNLAPPPTPVEVSD